MALDTQAVLADNPSEEVRLLIEGHNNLLIAIDTSANYAALLTAIQTGGLLAAATIELRPVGIPAAMSSRFPRR